MNGEPKRGPTGDKALQLVLEMKRNPDILPPYNHDLMRQCHMEIAQLVQANSKDVEKLRADRSHDQSMLQPRLGAMCHIRRCMMAYVNERKNRIRSYRWKYGGALPASIRNALCDAEIQFFNDYSSTLARFQSTLGENGVNLLLHTKPPKSLFVQVRALDEYGEFETSDGTLVMLTKDSMVRLGSFTAENVPHILQHSLPRADCEMLIRQGVLELVH